MEKLQARKKVYLWLLILLSLCALIPLAVLSKYNHQSGDDYGYAYRTFQILSLIHIYQPCHMTVCQLCRVALGLARDGINSKLVDLSLIHISLIQHGLYALEFGDIFMRCVYATRPYEAVAGSTDELHEKWKKEVIAFITQKKMRCV